MSARVIGGAIVLALGAEIATVALMLERDLEELRTVQPVVMFAGCTAHVPQRVIDRTSQQFSGCPGGEEYWIIKIDKKEERNVQANARGQR